MDRRLKFCLSFLLVLCANYSCSIVLSAQSMIDLLTAKKNALSAWPFEIAANAVDIICSSTLLLTQVPPQMTPNINNLHFQYMTPCKNYSVPILNAQKLWKHNSFNKKKKVVILATGWTNTVNQSEAITIMSKAFFCRPRVNFLVVDTAYYVDTLYKWSALNTDLIGEQIAIGLVHLTKLTPLRNIHLVGHSLGAHIMGTAGRVFKRLTGRLIPRITGLDPAKPCFRKNKPLYGLFRGDAKFVDIIHSNIGILAKRGPLGDIDFYPGGANPFQPGCLSIACSHSRAVAYFSESVYPGHQHDFPGFKCDSWNSLKMRDCAKKSKSSMGYVINKRQRGIFLVDVNSKPPYGKNIPLNLKSKNATNGYVRSRYKFIEQF